MPLLAFFNHNELPRSKLRGIKLEKRKLLFSMKLFIFLFPSLLTDVVPKIFFISMTTYRIDEEPLRPELSAPQLLFNLWNTFEYLPGCYTFHNLAEPARTVCRHRLKQKMNMVGVRPNFNETHLITTTYLKTNLFQFCVYLFRKNNPAVFCRTDQMIQQNRNIVLFVDKCAHA